MEEDDMTYDDELDAGYASPEEGNEDPGTDPDGENENSDGHDGEEDEESEEEQNDQRKSKKGNSPADKASAAYYKQQLIRLHAAHNAFGGYKLSPRQKKLITKASEYDELKPWIRKIYLVLAKNFTKMVIGRIRNALVAIGPWGIVAILVLVAIAVVCLLLFSADSGETIMGVTGKDFYGCRLVYENEERAKNDLADNYLEIINNSIDVVDINNPTLEINIAMPSEEYVMDYSTFTTDYPTLGGAVWSVAKIVSKFDNSQASSATDLATCLGEIKYFGLPNDANTTSDIVLAIADFIIDVEDLNIDANSISSHISSVVKKYQTRTEKLYIKDCIFESEDEMMGIVDEECYVAFVFMPKNEVTFTSIVFQILSEDLTGVSLKLFNGETQLTFTLDEKMSGTSMGEKQKNVYSTDKHIAPGVFQDIDTNNLSALSQGVSLFEIVKTDALNKDVYLKTSAENSNLLIYKRSGLRIEVAYEGESVDKKPCTLNEFQTGWIA